MINLESTRYKEFYRNESVRYHALRYETLYGRLFQSLHHHVLCEVLDPLSRQARVLEVACGTGHITKLSVDMGFRPVACDLTPQMMHQARALCQGLSLFLETDAFQLPFENETFDALISTRFLHLFPHEQQQLLIVEMLRVLKPGGLLVVDFDNFFSRWLLAIPFLIYNLIRYHRVAPDSNYNRIKATEKALNKLGVTKTVCYGIGGTHLIIPCWFSQNLAFFLGLKHQRKPLRCLAEQFVVCGRKGS
ncbi:MAG: class I SAM-dependent methyltransferase [Deltaproteobacteria bacterium]|nr:class I SAM-dependent methyltransferase [Deltaproteobacteria bacterium]